MQGEEIEQGVSFSRSQCSLQAERLTTPEPGKVVTQSRVVRSHPTRRRLIKWWMEHGACLVGDEEQGAGDSCRQGARVYRNMEGHRANREAIARGRNAL